MEKNTQKSCPESFGFRGSSFLFDAYPQNIRYLTPEGFLLFKDLDKTPLFGSMGGKEGG